MPTLEVKKLRYKEVKYPFLGSGTSIWPETQRQQKLSWTGSGGRKHQEEQSRAVGKSGRILKELASGALESDRLGFNCVSATRQLSCDWMGPSHLPRLEASIFSTYSMGSVRKIEQHCAFSSECRHKKEEPWQRRPGGCQRESRGWTGCGGPWASGEGPISLPDGPHQPCLRVQAPRPVWLSTHPPNAPPLPHQCCPCAGSSPAISQERGRKDRQGESPKRS